MDKFQKNALKILNKDRGECKYCGRKLSLFDVLTTENVCEKCVRKHHREAMGIYN